MASSLESINTQIASISGQLDIWRVKRDEKKDFTQINCHMKMLKKKELPKGRICELFKKPNEKNIVREGTK